MSLQRFVLTGLTALACLGSSEAFANGRNPGSLLVYPEFDNRQGDVTLLTVTNTNSDFTPSANPLIAKGSTYAHFKYIGRVGNVSGLELLCEEFDRTELLTPNDTITLLTRVHNPQQEQGYVYVYAQDIQGRPVVHNWLIGNVLTLNGLQAFEFSMNPFVYNGIGDGVLTNLDGDSNRDLDGVEYEESPDEILIPRFLGQGGVYQSELILIGLTGGAKFLTTVDFLIYNDNEEQFSAEYSFLCWARVPLLQITGLFANNFLQNFTNDNPAEIVGAPMVESGWMRIDGALADSTAASIADPAILAALIEKIGDRGASDLPFERGLQNNGDLLPRSLFGDL